MNLKDFLVNSARLFPDKTAVIFREKRLTYGELYRDTCICGSALRNMGVKKGDSICIAARNCVEYLELIFGCSMKGAVPWLINWRLSPEALAEMAGEADPKALGISNTDMAKTAALNDGRDG